MKPLLKTMFVAVIIVLLSISPVLGNPDSKTKFYDFDDLLINGKVRKPQVLYTDARQKVKFERLLKLKKDFIPKLTRSSKDPSLR